VKRLSYQLTVARVGIATLHQTLRQLLRLKSEHAHRSVVTLWHLFDETVTYEEDPSGTATAVTALKNKWDTEYRAYENARHQVEAITKGPLKAHREKAIHILKVLLLYHLSQSRPQGLRDLHAGQDQSDVKREDRAAAHVEEFVQKKLQENPELEGIHFSDLFEHFLILKDKPRRLLKDLLPDYLYKTAEGTWRPPQTEAERQFKLEGRKLGTNRRMKRVVQCLESDVPVRPGDRPDDVTLCDWIRQCKKSGLYDWGKILFEKGGLDLESLSESTRDDVVEDHHVCCRKLAQQAGVVKPRRGRNASSGQRFDR
jgi:hypothetical protein